MNVQEVSPAKQAVGAGGARGAPGDAQVGEGFDALLGQIIAARQAPERPREPADNADTDAAAVEPQEVPEEGDLVLPADGQAPPETEPSGGSGEGEEVEAASSPGGPETGTPAGEPSSAEAGQGEPAPAPEVIRAGSELLPEPLPGTQEPQGGEKLEAVRGLAVGLGGGLEIDARTGAEIGTGAQVVPAEGAAQAERGTPAGTSGGNPPADTVPGMEASRAAGGPSWTSESLAAGAERPPLAQADGPAADSQGQAVAAGAEAGQAAGADPGPGRGQLEARLAQMDAQVVTRQDAAQTAGPASPEGAPADGSPPEAAGEEPARTRQPATQAGRAEAPARMPADTDRASPRAGDISPEAGAAEDAGRARTDGAMRGSGQPAADGMAGDEVRASMSEAQGLEPEVRGAGLETGAQTPGEAAPAAARGADRLAAPSEGAGVATSESAAEDGRSAPARQALLDQVVRSARLNLERGVSKFELRLHPPRLGRLGVLLEVRDGALSVSFRVESEAVREMLQNSLPQLRAALSAQGVGVDGLDVSGWGRGTDGQPGAGTGSGQAGGAPQAEAELPPEEFDPVRTDGGSAVDYLA